MKTRSLLLLLAIALSLSCAKRKFYKNIVSTWYSYELTNEDGTVWSGQALNGQSIFGVYNPHIIFEDDKKYVPFTRGASENLLKTTEAGTYEYKPKTHELYLKGGMADMTFNVQKFEGDELWLKSLTLNKNSLIKLRRE